MNGYNIRGIIPNNTYCSPVPACPLSNDLHHTAHYRLAQPVFWKDYYNKMMNTHEMPFQKLRHNVPIICPRYNYMLTN